MFISAAGFKRIIKDAFKNGGLWLGNDGSGTIIAGSYWAMKVEEGALTKKAKASIIELTGVIPEAGEMFWCTGKGNQLEMEGVRPEITEVRYNAGEAEEELKDTGITIDDGIRMLQSAENGKIWIVNNGVFKMISYKNTEEGEEEPVGPMLGIYRGVYWINDHMAFMLLQLDNGEKTMITDYLEKIDVNEYRKTKISEN